MGDKEIRLLEDILQEMKWQSKQNEKITELLTKLRQPCGQNATADVAGMMKMLKEMSSISKNPAMSKVIDQAEEAIKKAGL